MLLSDLKEGETAIIKSVECDNHHKKRLSILGLNQGVKVKLIRRAPFSDPIEINIRGFCLAIRESLASKIYVEKI